MAFPYVSTSDDEKLENTLISGFAENCASDFEGKHITYTDTCAVSDQDLKKHHNMDSISVSYCNLFSFLSYLFHICYIVGSICIAGLGDGTDGKQPKWAY
jgi:hypothetical protein